MIKTEEYPVTEGINFRSIQDTRFKTLRIAVNFMLPLEKETAAANALLPFLLSRASREYPDFTRLNERLSELYGAAIHADVRKLGEAQVLSIAAAGLADRYALEGESISAELSMPERTLNHPVRQGKAAEHFESTALEEMIE